MVLSNLTTSELLHLRLISWYLSLTVPSARLDPLRAALSARSFAGLAFQAIPSALWLEVSLSSRPIRPVSEIPRSPTSPTRCLNLKAGTGVALRTSGFPQLIAVSLTSTEQGQVTFETLFDGCDRPSKRSHQ